MQGMDDSMTHVVISTVGRNLSWEKISLTEIHPESIERFEMIY